MTREDIRKQFPEATEEQITVLLDIYGADIANAKKNNIEPKELKRLQEIEAAYTKLQEAGLTDAEKTANALKAAETAKIEYAKKSNRLDAEKILVAAGLTEEEYKDLIDGIVSDDAERTKTLATNLASMVSKQKAAVEQRVKEEIMDNTLTPGRSGTGSIGTEEETKAEKVAKSIAETQKSSNETTKSVLESYL